MLIISSHTTTQIVKHNSVHVSPKVVWTPLGQSIGDTGMALLELKLHSLPLLCIIKGICFLTEAQH